MTRSLVLLACFFLAGQLRADEQIRSVQEELRRRNVYFGDIDGRRTPELEQATRQFQKRKGFAASGDADRDTLRSLGLLPRSPDEAPPKELDWPDEPVLKSDAKIDVAAEARAIARETGVSPASVTTVSTTTQRTRSSSRGGRTRPAGEARTAGGRAAASRPMESAAVRDFVADYLKAVSRNDVRDELRFYADHVDYYANGQVDRRIIEKSLANYYRRWPSRSSSLQRIVGYDMVPGRGEIVVTFRVNVSLKDRGRKVRGITDNRLTINAATADPRIVAIDERRVRL